jgi:DNA-binding response OmpR family regulator
MKVLLVDDEKVILTVSREALSNIAEEVVTHTDPTEALKEELTAFDVILSDFYMPGMRGDEFLGNVKERAPDVPFIFLTQNDDLGIAVELIRHGADDYISKPIDPKTFVFRVKKIIAEKEREQQIARIMEEQKLLDMENRKLSNWRLLYASKDARQTETLVANLARNLNQSGGFLWLDMLESSYTENQDGSYTVPKAVLDMALTSARNQRRLFDRVEFIGTLDETEFEMEEMTAARFHAFLESQISERFQPIAEAHGRSIDSSLIDFSAKTAAAKQLDRAGVSIDRTRITDVLHELVVNAIKFSPEDSPITFSSSVIQEGSREILAVEISNPARRFMATDAAGKQIYGIPYDYQELIFDLFFTIDAFPEYLAEEQWPDGTGLYIARKIMRKMNGWISAQSGVDYTWKQPQPLVRIDIRLPVIREES